MTDTRGGVVGGLATTDTTSERLPKPATAGGRGGRRGNPFARLSLFWKQMVAELRKVIWPTRHELITYTIVAVVFVSVMIAFISLLDIGFAKGVLQVFG